MARLRQHFPPFVGGAELTWNINIATRDEAREPLTSLDLTGYSISAEVWWEGCRKLSPAIEVVDLSPANPETGADHMDPAQVHYRVTLNEQQTAAIPLGRVAFMKLIRQSPEGVTSIEAPIWLTRTA
jgi:hypothetical protein